MLNAEELLIEIDRQLGEIEAMESLNDVIIDEDFEAPDLTETKRQLLEAKAKLTGTTPEGVV